MLGGAAGKVSGGLLLLVHQLRARCVLVHAAVLDSIVFVEDNG